MNRKRLRLYVVANTPSGTAALSNARQICRECLDGDWDLEVIDVVERPDQVEADHISAVPALVKKEPRPSRRVVGDLSDHRRVLMALEIFAEKGMAPIP